MREIYWKYTQKSFKKTRRTPALCKVGFFVEKLLVHSTGKKGFVDPSVLMQALPA